MTEKSEKIHGSGRVKQFLGAGLILLIPLLIMYSSYIFNGVRPLGVDSIASKGGTRLYLQWEDQSGEKALWNPNKFGGMPIYHRISPPIPHPDKIVGFLGRISYLYFWYFLVGGFGVFSLLLRRRIPWYGAVICALGFILLPHWQALIHVGHYSKLRAFMVLPWLVLSFQYLWEKRSWTAVGLFAMAFSWMIRTQHVQVVFYAILLLLFLYIVPVFRMLFRKEYSVFGNFTVKVIAGIILTVLIAAQPFLSLNEYTPESTRGGNPLKIGREQVSASKAKGVSFEYATRWSLSPKEVMTFVIPRFFGGTSGEIYEGNAYPRLRGRSVPGYWGDMPFTQSYDSMGILLFLLALLGIIAFWKKDAQVRALAIFTVFALFLGFGRHFPPLYKLFFYFVPYFSKFRVPVMIVNMIFFTSILLAGYGLKAIFDKDEKSLSLRQILWVFGSASGILILILIFKGQFSYLAGSDAGRYSGATLAMVKGIRQEFLTQDTTRALLLALAAGAGLSAFRLKKMHRIAALILLLAAVSFELGTVTRHAYRQIPLGSEAAMERRQFAASDITRFLDKAPDGWRGLVIGRGFQDNHYVYWYPMINGYSAIKLQTIQDATEHLLFTGSGPARVNWNAVNMLSGRFIIAPGQINQPFLTPVAGDKNRNEILYENSGALPEAWFVESLSSVASWEEAVQKMNAPDFDPSRTAFTTGSDGSFAADGHIRLKAKNPNRLVFDYSADSPHFAVISEMYYSKGWKAVFNDAELKIDRVNYLLRGVKLPAGEGELVMTFEPETYRKGTAASFAGALVMWLLVLGGAFADYRKKQIKPDA